MSDPSGGTREQSPEGAESPSPHAALAPGEAIPNLSSWILERRLGDGGFGEVWLARHAWNEKVRPRAVKFCTEPLARHRLVTHEKNVVLRVMRYAGDHPNIVPLLDCNLSGDIPWLMYEYVEGGTLAHLIEQWRALPLPKRLGRAARALSAIAGALATCHRLSPPLVHRDLKPQNVLMAGGKVPRITDFGIGSVAIPKDGAAPSGPTAFAAVIPTAMRATGTRLYAPPEQLLGAPPSPREDVYALGVMAFQMIAGDPLSGPGSDAEWELRDLRVPSELASLIVRSTAMDPLRRPADASVWESALARLLHKEPSAGIGSASGTETEVASGTADAQSGTAAEAAPRPDPAPPFSGTDRPTSRRPKEGRGNRIVTVAILIALFALGLGIASAVVYYKSNQQPKKELKQSAAGNGPPAMRRPADPAAPQTRDERAS